MITDDRYSEWVVLERIRQLDDWWYDMNDFALNCGYSKMTCRITLDRLRKKGRIQKLVDAEGEGYYLAEDEE